MAQKNIHYSKTFSCTGGEYPLEWNIETNATWLSSDDDGVEGTPARKDVGDYYILVNVTDDDGRSDEVNFSLVVEPNEQPCEISIETGEFYILNESQNLKILIMNPDYDQVAYTSVLENFDHFQNTSGMFSTKSFVKEFELKDSVITRGYLNISVWADDGVYNITSYKNMTVLTRPTARIISISPNPVKEGEIIAFNGTGVDEDGTVVAYEWSSDIDGVFSTTQKMENSSLSPGIHAVSFRVWDNDNLSSLPHTMMLTVKDKLRPVAGIISINPNPAIEGENITFIGMAVDNDNGTILVWQWRSDIDGTFLNSPNGTINWLSVGAHTISLKVRDDDGLWSEAVTKSLTITINNTKPVLTISSPVNNAVVLGRITFKGKVEDIDGNAQSVEVSIDDGHWIVLSGVETWSYSWDTSSVENGEHKIRFRAHDGIEFSDEVEISVVVENEEDTNTDDTDDAGFLPGFEVVGVSVGIIVAVVWQRKQRES